MLEIISFCETQIISHIASYPSIVSVSVKKRRILKPSISISESNKELSNFDSEIPITAALDRQAVRQSSSILGKRLFMLMWIK